MFRTMKMYHYLPGTMNSKNGQVPLVLDWAIRWNGRGDDYKKLADNLA
jgi:hypothetical protein